jgi:low affinity Fe/Cu permease
MSESKTRKTKVVVHCAKSTLVNKFPDIDEVHTLTIMKRNGEVVVEKEGRTEGNELLQKFADEAGYDTYWATSERQDKGWAVINGKLFSILTESERKCSFTFQTINTDENDHYAKLDEIIRTLAENDVAILQGECSITVTTRC